MTVAEAVVRQPGRIRRVFSRIFGRPRKANRHKRMTLLEHLDELRYRFVWVCGAVALASIVGWVAFDRIVETLLVPARPYLRGVANEKLIFTGPLEVFTLRLKIALYIGIVIAFPIILFHFWRFVVPALSSRERRYAVPFVVSGTLLFVGGLFFANLTLPQALEFLIGPAISGPNIDPLLSGKQYLDFMLFYLIAFGLAFEFPMVLMGLSLAGVLPSRQMAKYRRHTLIGIAVVVAFATPSVDLYSMVVLTVAMYAMFESCIWISRLLKK
jgi:sec-independent protein translocase protein TatC